MATATASPACPRCGGSSARAFRAVDRNRAVSDEVFSYSRCHACGVIWLAEPPEDLERYYPGDYHEFLDARQLGAAAAMEAPRIGLLRNHVQGGRLVEVGPSQGIFSAAARAAGFEVVALEMDAACCRHLEDVVGVEAIQTSSPDRALAQLPPSRAVVMWHVLEHLPHPWAVLRAVGHNLEAGGILALAVPNPRSLQQRVFGARWVHLDAPRHLTLIPLPALRDEADELGLDLVSATATDPVGLGLNQLGWERSVLRAPTLRPDPRLVHTIGRALTAALGPVEKRGLRGAAYTAVFRKRQ